MSRLFWPTGEFRVLQLIRAVSHRCTSTGVVCQPFPASPCPQVTLSPVEGAFLRQGQAAKGQLSTLAEPHEESGVRKPKMDKHLGVFFGLG